MHILTKWIKIAVIYFNMKTMIIVLQFFFNHLSTVINIIIISTILYLKSLLFLMIIKYFYHMFSTETFPKKTIKI